MLSTNHARRSAVLAVGASASLLVALTANSATAAPTPVPTKAASNASCPATPGVTPTSVTLGWVGSKTGAAATTTCDSAHNTAALRKALGDHTMTVTLTTPVWIGANDAYALYLLIDCAAGTVLTFKGARCNYTERM